ncbi:hypothetical protein ACHAXS_012082 [Conticribra weissflogii]
MNSIRLAHNFSQSSRGLISRHFSRGAIPTTASVELGGYKIMGMPHLSTSSMKWGYRKKYWLSDPSTYPLLAALGFATGLCTGFGIYFLGSSPDVQISPIKR